ncbi:MAG: Perchlorate reductase subunit alpha [Acidimicrobiales bacterium]|nr:Perchlorate reductase subunit alpha [Acidimicrobiales bacterium]
MFAPTDAAQSTRSGERHYRRRTEFDEVAWGSHCVDCYPGSCPYHVFVKDGKIVREEVPGPFFDDEPEGRGFPDGYPMGCNKGAAWSQQIDSPDRLRYPMRRVGERGSGEWERISWDEALDEIADALIDTITSAGPEAILKEGTPEVATVMATDRFLGLLGATVTDLNGSINDFAPGHHLTFGKFFPILGDGEIFQSDVLIFWHTNPAYTLIPMFHTFAEARYHGTEIVLISPDVSPSHSHVDYHVPLRWESDPAVALAMCQVIVEEGLVDEEFVATQTDLSLLVRRDTGRFLRESDIEDDGNDEQFFHLDRRGTVVPASRSNLLCDHLPELAGSASMTLADGTSVDVEPLFVRLRQHLASYSPESVAGATGVNPETLRTIARKVAHGRTRIIMGMGANKAYHSDLYQRTMNLLLGLTGNWGRRGAGINCWAATQIDGQLMTGAKPMAGVEGAEQVLVALDAVQDLLHAQDPTMSDELVSLEMWRGGIGTQGGGMVPPVFFWYWHCGFADRWNNPAFNDPDMKRSFDEYFDEALESRWWEGLTRPGPECPPRVLIECGGNILRRTRGGRGILLENLWPKLDKIITIDFRMSTTALHSDIVLPAAQHYEKVALHIPILAMILGDKATEPLDEAKPEWEIFAELCQAMARRAAARGLESFTHTNGLPQRYDDLWNRYTLNGVLGTQERAVDEVVRDSAYAGVLPEDTDLAKLREKGYLRFTDWGRMGMAKGQAAPWPKAGEPFSAFTNHVERGDPYPTLTRRAQFLIEHPWFVEAGEDLPVHKDPPDMGGDKPFRMTTGHNRWSIHEMNMANPVLLQTHRGEPHAVVHPADARARGIADGAPMRVFNDVGSFVVNAKYSPGQRPGGVTVYNGWAPFMFADWTGPNDVEPGMVKYLGLAGGYGHLRYGPLEWQPVPIDRDIFVDIEAL